MENNGIWLKDPSRFLLPPRKDYSSGDGTFEFYDTMSNIEERRHRRITRAFIIIMVILAIPLIFSFVMMIKCL